MVAGLAAGVVVGATRGVTGLLSLVTENDAGTAVAPPPPDPYRVAGWIAGENGRIGTGDWVVPDDPTVWRRVRGFADVTSVPRGGTATLRVSTAAERWWIEAFRMGWYGGSGARPVWRSDELPGTEQPDPALDRTTGMREARWEPGLEVTAGDDWPPGMYLLRLASSDGGASFVPLVVRDDDSAATLGVQSSVTTWQAYNDWGGANLYRGTDGGDRARVVSFDRPYGGNGSGEFFGREFEFVQWAERLGLDVTYWTDVDLHADPARAARHRAVITLGHDEYYSLAMRTGLEDARDSGTNLAFLGANACYRRIRLEPSELGPHRREVNYRVAAEDPRYGHDDREVTTSWREAPEARPESSLVGNYYDDNPVDGDHVVVEPDAWIFEGTGVEDGTVWAGVVGNEFDRVTPEVPTPESIQVLCHSPVVCKGRRSFADATWYTAGSGAGVFASGTLWWERWLADPDRGSVEGTTHFQIQRTTENLLRAFADGPAGAAHPSEPNLDRFGIEPGYLS